MNLCVEDAGVRLIIIAVRLGFCTSAHRLFDWKIQGKEKVLQVRGD